MVIYFFPRFNRWLIYKKREQPIFILLPEINNEAEKALKEKALALSATLFADAAACQADNAAQLCWVMSGNVSNNRFGHAYLVLVDNARF